MVAAVYPVLVFTLLVVFRVDTKILSLVIVALAAAFFLSATGKNKTGEEGKKSALDWKPLLSSGLFLAAGLFCFITGKEYFLKIYSVVINITLLFVFASTLFMPPNIIFRFATLADKSIKGSSYEEKVRAYCRNVTIVWCVFFVLNGTAAFCTTFADRIFGLDEQAARKVWAVYNGGISYVLMGTLFVVEFIVRKVVDSKMIKAYPITKFNADSRKDNYVLCYNDTWSKKDYKTWKDFLIDTAKIREFVTARPADEYILHCEDYWYFLCTFVALLQSKKAVYLTQNISESFMADVKKPGMIFLTDQKTPDDPDTFFIPDLVEKSAEPAAYRDTPQINGEETRIFLFTSGSTGAPKAVPQRMKEFEEDNAFIISKWGGEITSRKLVTTVSQHHIYGFLFGISLPFTLGTPFRRNRVEFPEEFEKLTDEKYILIATPAFLKRTVEAEERLGMKDIWIFTSGGAVSPELAASCGKLFDFYPLEVYGSTETSGIAYRQQDKDGLVWTPFANAKIWLGDDGCLRIISPYIKNPEGFATADLAEIREDGRFILKGRSDSIVKIEEKRISLTEVENRILESNLVKDVKVVALSNDVRQYLAAAIVLNDDGRAKFKDCEKFIINRYFHDHLMKFFENVVIPKKWRFLDALPVDVQGKTHRLEIEALFKD